MNYADLALFKAGDLCAHCGRHILFDDATEVFLDSDDEFFCDRAPRVSLGFVQHGEVATMSGAHEPA